MDSAETLEGEWERARIEEEEGVRMWRAGGDRQTGLGGAYSDCRVATHR